MKRARTDPPDELPASDRNAIARWAKQHFGQPWVRRLELLWSDCRDYYALREEQSLDWSAQFRRWVKREYEHENRPKKKYEEVPRGSSERPQERRENPSEKRNLVRIRTTFNEEEGETHG